MFFVLKNLKHKLKNKKYKDSEPSLPIFLEEEVERYIEINFLEVSENWMEEDFDKMYSYKLTKAKQCTQ